MIILWVSLIALAVATPAAGILLVRGYSSRVRTAADIIGRIQPLDLVAFANLMDPAEDSYLRANLPAPDFRAVHRSRLVAAADYVRCAASNASLLLRLGDAARASSDPTIAAAGAMLSTQALKLRVSAILVLGRIYAGIAIPGVGVSVGSLLQGYGEMTGSVTRLCRIQSPARTSAVYSAM